MSIQNLKKHAAHQTARPILRQTTDNIHMQRLDTSLLPWHTYKDLTVGRLVSPSIPTTPGNRTQVISSYPLLCARISLTPNNKRVEMK